MNDLQNTQIDWQAIADVGGQMSADSAQRMKYKRGAYYAGADGEKMSADAEFVVSVASLTLGWTKWSDGQPVDQRVAYIANGERLPHREELGDLDRDLWPKDPHGVPQDPWSQSYAVVMKSVETGEQFLFQTSSMGGKNAVGRLCQSAAAQSQKAGATVHPVIQLKSRSYHHKKLGIDIDTPVFEVKSFKTEAELAGKATADLDDDIPW